jgi:hypothetical protein
MRGQLRVAAWPALTCLRPPRDRHLHDAVGRRSAPTLLEVAGSTIKIAQRLVGLVEDRHP